jgi:SAM-dependent methyltransferase
VNPGTADHRSRTRRSPPTSTLNPMGVGHRHIRDVLIDELAARNLVKPVVLDAGCGDGMLLDVIGQAIDVKLCGFDSAEYGLQAADFIGSRLADADIRHTLADGSWPFEDESVDIVVSHQVIEHVFDFTQFCAESERVLRPGGFALHVFPTRHTIIELHMLLPFVHRIRSHDVRATAIQLLTRLGLGSNRELTDRAAAAAHADYSRTYTTYRSWRELVNELHRHGFRVSYRHSSRLLKQLVFNVMRIDRKGRVSHPFVEALWFPLVRSLVSVTLVIEKQQDYRSDWKLHGRRSSNARPSTV